jgi:hypothetical protein
MSPKDVVGMVGFFGVFAATGVFFFLIIEPNPNAARGTEWGIPVAPEVTEPDF